MEDQSEIVSEKEQMLLRELQALFENDGLLSHPNDVAVVAARSAYPEYLLISAYICQANRTFQPIRRIAFYRNKRIECEVPEVLATWDEVELTQANADELSASEDERERQLAEVIRGALREGSRSSGQVQKVMLLSAPHDERTLRLAEPVVHREKRTPGFNLSGTRRKNS